MGDVCNAVQYECGVGGSKRAKPNDENTAYSDRGWVREARAKMCMFEVETITRGDSLDAKNKIDEAMERQRTTHSPGRLSNIWRGGDVRVS